MAEIGPMLEKITSSGRRRGRVLAYAFGALFIAGLLLDGLRFYRTRMTPTFSPSQWVRLTDLDYATQPALSADGRMLAFIRGPGTFTTSGEIYIKELPNGEPVQLTSDSKTKMSPIFSPDGSEIAYTVPFSWDTWVAPVLGGQSRLLLRNASGLTWIGHQRLLFSQIDHGRHMCVVTATKSLLHAREVYAPHDESGMAHYSYLSPDRRWILIVEMDALGSWLPCRLVPFDGSSRGNAAGPLHAGCTSAAWSPDGRWMFFSSNAGGGVHIWRQRFPDGRPEQITSGPTEEEGTAIARDGHSLVTSVGLTQGTVWIHDPSGDRQISSEGYAVLPGLDSDLARSVFSPNGKRLYYLVKRGHWPGIESELWMADLTTGHSEPALLSFQSESHEIQSGNYDISPDGKRVVFSALDAENRSYIWLGPLNIHTPPHQIPSTSASDSRPVYGPNGELFFEATESGTNFVYRMNEDGTGRRKVIPNPIIELQSVSPDGEWVVVQAAVSGEERTRAVVAYSIRDGSVHRICDGLCFAVLVAGREAFQCDLARNGQLRHSTATG
jgi:Tol biopolymer transport system component